jgi:NAD(P)-dependent dehydrogenase (short-subunit alcohol dehydrogenase family)
MLGKLTPLHHYDPSTWDNVINLNLIANQRLIRSFDPLLRQSSHGRAIFLSATVARVATPYWGAYATSKSGLEMMIQVYAKETEKTNLKVNIVDPGITKTSLRASAFPGEDPSKLKSPKTLVPLFLKLCSAENQAHGQLIKYDEYDEH